MNKQLFFLLTVGMAAFLVTACAAKETASSFESQPESSISSSLSVSAGKTVESKALATESASSGISSSSPKAGSSASEKGAPSSSQAQPAASSSTPVPAASKPVATPSTAQQPPQSQAPPPVTEPDPTPPVASEPPPAPEPTFDANTWVNFAIAYGESIGLTADSSVTGSWDNPIIAGPGSLYLERDICGMLDWYKAEGATRFWVWASPRADGKYDLYIGYS